MMSAALIVLLCLVFNVTQPAKTPRIVDPQEPMEEEYEALLQDEARAQTKGESEASRQGDDYDDDGYVYGGRMADNRPDYVYGGHMAENKPDYIYGGHMAENRSDYVYGGHWGRKKIIIN